MSDMDCLEVHNACRLCLLSSPNNIDLYSEKGQKQALQHKVWKYFSLWVCVEDALPRSICELCSCKLDKFHAFALEVEEVQKNIQEIVTSRNSKIRENNSECAVKNLECSIEPNINDQISRSFPSKHSEKLKNCSEIPVFSRVQEQSLIGVDIETETLIVNEQDVPGVKVEKDPLEVENSINYDTNAVQTEDVGTKNVQSQYNETSNGIAASEFVSVNINDQTKCSDLCQLELEDSTVCCGESTVQATPISGPCKKRVAQSQKSESDCNESEDEDEDMEQYENSQSSDSGKPPLNTQLAKFYKYDCKMCDSGTTIFYSFFLLCKHYRLKHNIRGFVICCGRKLFSKPSLVTHMLQHLQPGLYKCPKCEKVLANELTYEKHMIHHLPEDERPFKCEQCNRGFARKGELQSHERKHIPQNERLNHSCDTCGKKFVSLSSLFHHQRYIHEKMRDAMCHICAKTFPTKSAVKSHFHTHSQDSERKQCVECGKWMKNDYILQFHIKRSHSNKQFECPHCDKVYTIPQSLHSHLKCHIEDDARPYPCTICGKAFKRKEGLKIHGVQHTGEKPYKCPHCPRVFACSANYYSHKKRMHGSEREISANTETFR